MVVSSHVFPFKATSFPPLFWVCPHSRMASSFYPRFFCSSGANQWKEFQHHPRQYRLSHDDELDDVEAKEIWSVYPSNGGERICQSILESRDYECKEE
ncbi:Adhesion G protein-coupled receptor F5 [Bienertia sinuspersici]